MHFNILFSSKMSPGHFSTLLPYYIYMCVYIDLLLIMLIFRFATKVNNCNIGTAAAKKSVK